MYDADTGFGVESEWRVVGCCERVCDIPYLCDKVRELTRDSDVLIKVVDTENMERVFTIRDLNKPAKHVSFDPSGNILTASCSDGNVYFYSMKEERPELVRKVDGLIRSVEGEDEACVKALWHPDGRAFAAPTAARGL